MKNFLKFQNIAPLFPLPQMLPTINSNLFCSYQSTYFDENDFEQSSYVYSNVVNTDPIFGTQQHLSQSRLSLAIPYYLSVETPDMLPVITTTRIGTPPTVSTPVSSPSTKSTTTTPVTPTIPEQILSPISPATNIDFVTLPDISINKSKYLFESGSNEMEMDEKKSQTTNQNKQTITEWAVLPSSELSLLHPESWLNGREFWRKWDSILKKFLPKTQHLRFYMLSGEWFKEHPDVLVINKLTTDLAIWVCEYVGKKWNPQVLDEPHRPLEIDLLVDLANVRRYYWLNHPIIITNNDIVGAIIKQKMSHEHLFVRYSSQTGNPKPVGFRFFVCQWKEKQYLLKPDTIHNPILGRTPLLTRLLGISPRAPKIFERNRVAEDINRLFHLSQLPEIMYVSYEGRTYTAVELLAGTPMASLSKEERMKLYQSTQIVEQFFHKQVLDMLLGNCDANPTNILVSDQHPVIRSIDYDLSLSNLFSDLHSIDSLLPKKNEQMRTQLRLASYYKGCPLAISQEISNKIQQMCPWRYYWQLLLLGDQRAVQIGLERFLAVKDLLKTDQMQIIDGHWEKIHHQIRQLSKEDRKNHTYLL